MDNYSGDKNTIARDVPVFDKKTLQVAVIGAGNAGESELEVAEMVGSLLAENGVILFSGGRGGVMEASCRGAGEKGGLVVGIVPGGEGNRYLSVLIRTHMGHARNVILVSSCDAVIAIGGEFGTLSEIALALKSGIPVYGISTWNIPGIIVCVSAQDAVQRMVTDFSP